MHIKTGTWENSNAVCESDSLCDPAVLVSTTNAEPNIRNRRLSPGSGNCGGGGGGGCIVGVEQLPHQPSPRDLGAHLNGASHGHAFAFRRVKERRGPHKSHPLRREGQRAATRMADRPQKPSQKERWVEDSLSLLKPPPAFPVQDSPAKLQPAVSYASKVKAGASCGVLEEDRPAIGMLLQNQWGLSFISDAQATTEPPGPRPAPQPTAPEEEETGCRGQSCGDAASASVAATSVAFGHCPTVDESSSSKLLLTSRHLVEALNYHSREWKAICNKQKDPKKIVWYRDTVEQPA